MHQTSKPTNGFQHRSLVGWISEFSSRPLQAPWPVITLDDPMQSDLVEMFELCQQVGFDKVVLWGLFVERRWPVHLEDAIRGERRVRIQKLLDAAHERGIKILSGLGVYSWGFEEIIENHPRLSRGNPRAMCPSEPESERWMQRVVDFVLSDFELDGVQMQSADQGRCQCQDCTQWGDVEYHARINDRTAQYIRSRWPDKVIAINNWGLSFARLEDIPHLQRMTTAVDILIDYNNSAGTHRKQLLDSLACAVGTLAGVSVSPPQRWERTKWFLPTTTINVPYLRQLYQEGGRAIEQFAVALANPGGEVTLRFMGKLCCHPNRAEEEALQEAIDECFEPMDSTTAVGLFEVFQLAEDAYFQVAEQPPHLPELFYIDGGLFPGPKGDEERYLLKMSEGQRQHYADAMRSALNQWTLLQAGVGKQRKWEHVHRSLVTVLSDIQRLTSA